MAPSSHEGETHTAVFQPLLVHSDLSHVLFLILHFNPLHLIFITAFAQLSALWCSQFMLVQQMIEDVCQSPFTSLLLLVYPLLYTQAFRCHPVVSCLSSFFPHVAGPTALNMPDLDPSFTFHLMFHVLGSSSVTSLQTLP